MYLNKSNVLACTSGILVALLIGFITIPNSAAKQNTYQRTTNTSTNEVHSHSDFLMILAGKKIDFTADKYQSNEGTELNPDIHLHAKQGSVMHRQADGVTIGQFFDSLGFKYTHDCLTTDAGTEYCSNASEQLQLYVNGTLNLTGPNYVPQDLDRILIVYGTSTDAAQYFDQITDDACLYSGSCPERGVAPSETCGLTCDEH